MANQNVMVLLKLLSRELTPSARRRRIARKAIARPRPRPSKRAAMPPHPRKQPERVEARPSPS